MRRVTMSFVLLALSASGAGVAHANGRFPASSAAVLSPRSDGAMLVRTTFGVLVSRDRGASWGYVCEGAVGFAGTEDPTYLITPKGAIVAATFQGVSVSRDGGCDWAFAAAGRESVFQDLTMHADGTIFAVRSLFAGSTDAGSHYDNRLFVSRDDAATFTQIGVPLDARLLVETVEVAPSDPRRLYLSAAREDGRDRRGALLASRDGGKTWQERAIPIIHGERSAFIGGVDPSRADRVYVRTSGGPDGPSRLLVTDDAGATFKVALEAKAPLAGFALSPDGLSVFAGGRDGLFVAPSRDLAFAPAASFDVQCLAAGADALFACSNEQSGFFVGKSLDRGATFAHRVHLRDLKSVLACPEASTVGRLCRTEWERIRSELRIGTDGTIIDAGRAGLDAGARDTAAAALAPGAPESSRSPSRLPWLIAVAVAGGVLAWILRRRR